MIYYVSRSKALDVCMKQHPKIRNNAEEFFQQSDLIAGWVQRAEKEFEKK